MASPKKTPKKKRPKNYQTGTKGRTKKSIAADKRRTAKAPGKRKSASGKTYYERRANRSDRSKKTRL